MRIPTKNTVVKKLKTANPITKEFKIIRDRSKNGR